MNRPPEGSGNKNGIKVAMDIQKLFDIISHEAIINTLSRKEVLHYPIYRIIKTCLHETIVNQWFGQAAEIKEMNIGVKQRYLLPADYLP